MTAASEKPGIELLLERVHAQRLRHRVGHRSWIGLCPVHDDHHPSLAMDYKLVDPGVWFLYVFCRACGARIGDVCKALGLDTWRVLSGNEVYQAGEEPPAYVAPLPSSGELRQWQRALAANRDVHDYLIRTRGLDDHIIAGHGLGLDGSSIVLPVFEADGLVNVRRYNLDPRSNETKMRGLAGRGSQIYPDVPRDGWLLVCEGEWDALVARRHGLPSVTSTAGAFGWNEEKAARLAGRLLVLVFDCDEYGRNGAAWLAELLAGRARKLKVVDLGLGRGEDLTDWFVTYGKTRDQLWTLMQQTPET